MKDDSGAVSGGNEECVIQNQRKGNPHYKVAKKLTALCPSVLWKAEFVSDNLEGLAEEICKENVQSTAWFLLTD